MKPPEWSALAAWIALAIALANLWYSVIRVWLKDRRASPAAQLDLFDYQTKSGWHQETRVVVTNHGPALMKKVEVQIFDGDGKSLELTEPSISVLWPKMPFQQIHSGQSLYLTLSTSLESRDPRGALVCWRDGRRTQQSEWIGLSYNRLLPG